MEGGRWNDVEVPAVYFGLTPAICCLDTFVHATGRPQIPLKITCFELPDDDELYLRPDPETMPKGWSALPADRSSMEFGTRGLEQNRQLGLIVPSAILPLESNLVVNPRHPAIQHVKVLDSFDFSYDPRMFKGHG